MSSWLKMQALLILFTLVLGGPAWADLPESAYASTVRLIDRLYLEANDVDEADLLGASAERLSDELHWLVVETSGSTVHLRHGDGTAIGSLTVGAMDTLPAALQDLEEMVVGSGYPLGQVDVRLAVLRGLTDALDRYSRILADDAKHRFDVRLKGTLVGIGATLRWEQGGLTIVDLNPGGPADLSGLRPGDLVLRIDGRSTVTMPVSEARRRTQGPDGTQVVLHVQRGLDDGRDVALTRELVIVPNVEHRVLDGSIGYVSIENVSQKTVYNLVNSLDVLRGLGALDRGLVLDLRGNTGGSMKEAARAADVFLDEGLLLRTVGRDGGRVQNLQERMNASPGGEAVETPLVVLVDDRTASGSEILAGALLELDRAVLVGTRTYGKGSVQKLYPLDGHTDLKLTVAQYLLANDRRIDHLGLVPDAVVGRVEVDGYGVRFAGFDESWQRTPWDEIIPWVVTEGSARSDADIDDLPLEIARRTAMVATEPTRSAGLEALATVTADLQVEEQGRLLAAMEHQGVNWSPPVDEGTFMDARVRVTAEPWEGRFDVMRVRAEVVNLDSDPLARALVQLDSLTSRVWDGVVIPIGAVPGKGRVVGEVAVPLEAGIGPREDVVEVRLRADGRPPLLAGEDVLAAHSSPDPDIRLAARLVDEKDGTWRAEVTVINEADHGLTDVEIRFGWPGDLDVEIVDQAVRIPVVPGRDRVRADLELVPGPEAPNSIPLQVRIDAARFGKLAVWPLELPVDGTTVALSAPRISRTQVDVAAPEGQYTLPLLVQDEGRVDHVVVYAHGEKIAWAPGGRGRVRVEAKVRLYPGVNTVYVEARDDDGIARTVRYAIRGEETAAVDASE